MSRYFWQILIIFCIVAVIAALFFFMNTPQGQYLVEKVTPDSGTSVDIQVPPLGARLVVLDNGLSVIIKEDKNAPVVSAQMWVNAGSITEGKWLGAGMSHILEHMLFKGTTTRSNSQIAQEVQDKGCQINAYTSFDRTVYYISGPSSAWMTMTDVLFDSMRNSTLPSDEYVKEQEVIRREFAMGYDNPGRMAMILMFEQAYIRHPYKFPVIGHIDVYNQLTRDDVMEYYKKMYVPQNITFVIVGDVDSHAVEAKVRELAAGWKRGPLPAPQIEPEPPQLSMREVNQESNVELTRLNMAWHIPDLTNPDVPALDVMSLILGQGRSSRLYQQIREEKSLVKSISAFAYTPGYPGIFGVSAICDPDKRQKTVDSVLEMVEQLKSKPVTQEELDKAKKSFLSDALSSRRTVEGIAAELGGNYFATRDLDFTTGFLEDIQKVTAADVMRVAKEYLKESNLTVTSLNPAGSLADKDEKVTLGAERSPVETFTLDNGIRLLVCRDNRVPFVTFRAVALGGLLAETPENNGIGKLLGKMILKGTKKRSAVQLATEIESVGGDISAESGNNSLSVNVEVLKSEFDLGLDIFSDVLIHSQFPDEALAREKDIQLAEIKAEQEQPMTIARNLLNRNIFGEHPYALRVNGTAESLSRIDRSKLQSFYQNRFSSEGLVISVFGDIDPSEVKKKVESAFKGLRKGKDHLGNLPATIPLTKGITVSEKVDKSQAIVLFGFNGVDVKSPDRFALEIIEEASSDLASRFFIRIREKMGLAYFVGARQFMGYQPGSFVFYVGTDPKKVDAVKKEMLAEIKDLAVKGLTRAEFERAKAKLIGAQQLSNQSASTLAYKTALNELYGLGPDFESRYAEKINSLTLEEVNAIASKYLSREGFVTVVVSPEISAQ